MAHLRSRCSRANKVAENPLKTAFPEFLFIRLPDIITYALAVPSVTEGFRVVGCHVTASPDGGFCLTLFRLSDNRISGLFYRTITPCASDSHGSLTIANNVNLRLTTKVICGAARLLSLYHNALDL